jgi:hypothetical protein
VTSLPSPTLLLARKILHRLQPQSVLESIRQDPALIMTLAGLPPDPWQVVESL